MRRPARRDVALLVAGILAVVGLGFSLRQQQTATVAVDPANVHVDRLIAPLSGRPTALIISDAYTSDTGLAELSYGCQAATRMGWLCETAAEAGTGYISGGAANRFPVGSNSGMSTSFGERIPRLAATFDPQVVILDGGRNDQFVPPEARFEVTASAIAQAHQTWPNARIVFVAPRFLDRPADDLDVNEKTIDQLKKASGFKDLVVVDPAAGFKDRDTAALISSDGTKPSPEGERALAAALADDLKRNGFEPAT